MRKRLKGVPTSGTVSIVVTDIEDFSGVNWHSLVDGDLIWCVCPLLIV